MANLALSDFLLTLPLPLRIYYHSTAMWPFWRRGMHYLQNAASCQHVHQRRLHHFHRRGQTAGGGIPSALADASHLKIFGNRLCGYVGSLHCLKYPPGHSWEQGHD
uniref:Uncharacterized protein n=1 Tax=Anguilla anguilla TaxID=7936 RepID=A0A0E9TQA4_ANGAN